MRSNTLTRVSNNPGAVQRPQGFKTDGTRGGFLQCSRDLGGPQGVRAPPEPNGGG